MAPKTKQPPDCFVLVCRRSGYLRAISTVCSAFEG